MSSSSTSFADLGVPHDLVTTLKARGIVTPSPIQSLTLADACEGRDLSGRAPTGSGKTLAFGIPLVLRVGRAEPRRPRGLVLVPTRELAAQVCGELAWLGHGRKLRVAAFYGGAGFGAQLKALRRGVDVVVACPGRLTDLIERGEVRLDAVEIVALDEADRMADMGFLPAVRKLLDLTPASRQTLLFSATLDGAVDTLVRGYQRNPVSHLLPDVEADLSLTTHLFWNVERDDRVRWSAEAVKRSGRTIVFCRTKHGADALTKKLERVGVRAVPIHGNRSQSQRERALAEFTAGRVEALVATDVAARGIHVDDVACVVHFDPPADVKDYQHRSGRTARAGNSGVVVSLVCRDQVRDVARMQKALSLATGVITPGSWTEPERVAAPAAPAARAAASTRSPSADGSSTRGTIRWFDARKGFGFIERHGGADVFVHFSAIVGSGHRRLVEGQQVEFDVQSGEKGDQARRVRVLAA